MTAAVLALPQGAARVTTSSPPVVTAQATHIQPEDAAVLVVDRSVQHRHHAGGDQHHRHLDRQQHAGEPHELQQRPRARPGCTRYQ